MVFNMFVNIKYDIFILCCCVTLGTFAVTSLMVGSVIDKYDCSGSDVQETTTFPLVTNSSTPEGSTHYLTSTFGYENISSVVSEVGSSSDTAFSPEMICKLEIATGVTMLVGFIQVLMYYFNQC